INQIRFPHTFRFSPRFYSLWSKLGHNPLQLRSQRQTARRSLPVISASAMRCASTRGGPPIYKIPSCDESKFSALALNQPSGTPIVRLKIAARQDDPSSKLTAGKVTDRPLHLV